MFGLFGADVGGSFASNYRCYPVSFIEKPQLEHGDKVILPPSALDRLASLRIEYPMLFRVTNNQNGKHTHCGVLEFVADEGMVYMPYWMMQNLLLEEGDVVNFKSTSLPKGTFVKLRPHTKDFLDISNPKAVLERTLRGFTCLTSGDSILVHYNNKNFFIDVVESKPKEAVSIVETDCEVDFAPPLDWVDPEPSKSTAKATDKGKKEEDKVAEEAHEEEPGFVPFKGSGCRLDGKPTPRSLSTSEPVDVPKPSSNPSLGGIGWHAAVAAKERAAAAAREEPNNKPKKNTLGSSPGSFGRRAAGRLVFGQDSKERVPVENENGAERANGASPSQGSDPPSFVPFSGKPNKLV